MNWIQTRDGKKFDLHHPKADVIDIEVIAVVLARTPRFGGHDICPTAVPYNNAQHSVLVSEIAYELPGHVMGKELIGLAGLLHDAHEVYSGFGDVLQPAKRSAPALLREWISHGEAVIDAAVCNRFGIPNVLCHQVVKQADMIALATEARDVMRNPPPEPWGELPPPLERRFLSMSILDSYKLFLDRFNDLMCRYREKRNSSEVRCDLLPT